MQETQLCVVWLLSTIVEANNQPPGLMLSCEEALSSYARFHVVARNYIRESVILTMCLALFLTGLIQTMLLPFLLNSPFHFCRGLVAD